MDEILKLIDVALKKRKLSASKASELAVGHFGLIKNMRNGQIPSFTNMEKLFRVLGINLTYGFEDEPPAPALKVPLLGYVAAGGDDLPSDTSVTFEANGHDNALGQVPAPPGLLMQLRGSIFALKVRGASMLPIYEDGDLLYVYKDDPARASVGRLIGRKCVVTLEDGDAYVKTLRRPDSGEAGVWNLESLNPAWPMMTNQRVVEALPVRHVTHIF
jgi:SOS-response transcriptional repressor LexA